MKVPNNSMQVRAGFMVFTSLLLAVLGVTAHKPDEDVSAGLLIASTTMILVILAFFARSERSRPPKPVRRRLL